MKLVFAFLLVILALVNFTSSLKCVPDQATYNSVSLGCALQHKRVYCDYKNKLCLCRCV